MVLGQPRRLQTLLRGFEMNVKELTEWLIKLPNQNATVYILTHTPGRGWYDQGGNVKTEEFTGECGQYDLYEPYNKLDGCTLLLGYSDD